MHEDKRLMELLQLADQAATGKPVSIDVPSCRRRAAMRQSARTGSAVVVTATLLIMSWLLPFHGNGPLLHDVKRHDVSRSFKEPIFAEGSQARTQDLTSFDNHDHVVGTSINQAMKVVRQEMEMIERNLELYDAHRRFEGLQAELSELEAEPPEFARLRMYEEFEFTAAITFEYADRLANEANTSLFAAAEYRHLIRNHPGTSWAIAAADALTRLP